MPLRRRNLEMAMDFGSHLHITFCLKNLYHLLHLLRFSITTSYTSNLHLHKLLKCFQSPWQRGEIGISPTNCIDFKPPYSPTLHVGKTLASCHLLFAMFLLGGYHGEGGKIAINCICWRHKLLYHATWEGGMFAFGFGNFCLPQDITQEALLLWGVLKLSTPFYTRYWLYTQHCIGFKNLFLSLPCPA